MKVLQRLQSCKSYVLDPHMKALASSLGKTVYQRHHSLVQSTEASHGHECVSGAASRASLLRAGDAGSVSSGLRVGDRPQMRLDFLAVTGNTLPIVSVDPQLWAWMVLVAIL